jgi:hypothetical protein
MATGIKQYIAQRRSGLVDPVLPTYYQPTSDPNALNQFLSNYFMNLSIFSRAPKCVLLTVNTTPTQIIVPPNNWPYLIQNPGLTIGITTSFIVASGTVTGPGPVPPLTPIGVANYLNAHWFLSVTNIVGTWDFIQQAEDPATSSLADTQTIFSGINATGEYYAYTGALGLATDLTARWNNTSGGGGDTITFTLSLTLKEGIGGGPTGLAKTIFIGGADVSVNNGLPIPEGNERTLLLGPDISIYSICAVSTTIKVFVL